MGTDHCELSGTSCMYQSQILKCTVMANFINLKMTSVYCFKESQEFFKSKVYFLN